MQLPTLHRWNFSTRSPGLTNAVYGHSSLWYQRYIGFWFCLFALCMPWTAHAVERIELEHGGLTLVGHLQTAGDPESGILLMLHGTLAHGRMELLSALQELLAERGLASLAVNLSYGIDRREGMFACDQPVTLSLEGHFAELSAWLAWLRAEGYGPVTLFGHSRGGNQMARFMSEQNPEGIAGLILLAPSTANPQALAEQYDRQSPLPLRMQRERAEELLRMEQPTTRLEGVRFLYCESVDVSAEAFLAYYHEGMEHDTPTVLDHVASRVQVIIGSEDTVVADLPDAMRRFAESGRVDTVTIDGADHFFRDFFAEDVADAMAAFQQTLD